jgi:hypothetical protein
MSFEAKRDNFFMTLFSTSIIMITVVLLIPLFTLSLSTVDKIVLLSVLLITIVVLISSVLFIKYEFHDDYLYIKGGLFFRRIKYDIITHVESSDFTIEDLLVGYRILSSKDGVVIQYKAGIGIIKISPKDKSVFISELRKRIPNVKTRD